MDNILRNKRRPQRQCNHPKASYRLLNEFLAYNDPKDRKSHALTVILPSQIAIEPLDCVFELGCLRHLIRGVNLVQTAVQLLARGSDVCYGTVAAVRANNARGRWCLTSRS